MKRLLFLFLFFLGGLTLSKAQLGPPLQPGGVLNGSSMVYNCSDFFGYQLGGAMVSPLDYYILRAASPYFFTNMGLSFHDLLLKYSVIHSVTITYLNWTGKQLVFAVSFGGGSIIVGIDVF